MAGQREIVDQEAVARLTSAALEFARCEIARIADAVVEDMQSQPAVGIFGDVAARHQWDEYCWAVQEGPFDDEIGWEDVRLGSLSGAFDEVVRTSIQCEVEKLPKHALVLLTVRALEDEDAGIVEGDGFGSVWIDGIVSVVLHKVNSKASGRRLELIGPQRRDVIGYEIEGSGMVWSILSDRGEAMDIVSGYSDELIDAEGDLSKLAKEMVEAFVVFAKEDSEEGMLSEFFERFDGQVRALVLECDVLPSLEDMRASLLRRLDD